MLRRFYIVIALISAALLANGQIEISGKVTHADNGEPLTGVNISVENSLLGTSTDLKGQFKLSLPEGKTHLKFSFMGMISQEITVTGDTVLDVRLKTDLLMMEGVVVTAIGIKREQKALGYSVQKLPGIELQQVHHDNFLNSLSGKVAGVQVTSSSGSAGASSYITIRGASSIDGNNQPLFIVDGIPISNTALYQVGDGVDMSNRAMDISVDDIESVSVLKGGAATALYGIRAANGAIVITTRKGVKAPGQQVSTIFRTSLTIDKVSQHPELQYKYGQGLYNYWFSGAPTSWGPRLDTCSYSRNAADWQYPGFDVDGAIVGINNENATGEPVRTYDQFDFFRTAISQNYALELSGGDEKASFLTSASYNNSEGVVPENRWERFSLRIHGDFDLTGKFNLFASANYIHSSGDLIQKGDNTTGVMLGLTRTPPTFNNAAGYEFEDGSQRNYRHGSGYDNPYWTANKNKFFDNIDRIISYAGFDWRLASWLQLDYRIGIDYFSDNWKNYFARGSANYFSGFVWINKYNERNINSDLILKTDHQINSDWHAGISLGHNIFETYSTELSSTGTGLQIPGFYNLMNASSISSSEYTTQVRRAAFYGVLDISFRSTLYFTLTGRNEWSTTLPAANNSFFYPSASLSWVFTELSPLRDNHIIPFGKLRFSWAQVANDALPYKTTSGFTSYTIASVYEATGLAFPLMGQSGFTLSNTIGNNELKPEKTITWEIGTDLRWLDNRIGLDLTYFNQVNKDLLINVPISATTGYLYKYMNAGEMASDGIEIVMALQPVRSSSWKWDAIFNFTKINNEVKKLAPGVDAVVLGGRSIIIAAYEGFPYQSIFGYDWQRDEKGNLVIDDNPDSPSYGFPTGNYDTIVNIGTVNPDWILGWNNIIRWKSISLSFLLDIKKGGDMGNGTRGALYYFGNHADTETREPDDLVIFEGVKESDGSPNDIQVVKDLNWYLLGEGSSFTGPGGQFVEKAGWIRLREITLSYEPVNKKPGRRVKSLSFYLSGRNLWLHTKYRGIDPETSLVGSSNGQGNDYFNNPGTKGMTIGIKLGL